MKDEPQRRLVQRLQSGDASAEEELFQKYKDPILWKVHRSIETDAENIKDVASEVYLAIIQGLRNKSFQPEKWESLEAYIWGVVNNKVHDWFKNNRRDKALFDDKSPSEEMAAAVDDYLLENEEMGRLLRNVLQNLDAKYKEVLEMRYLDELSIPEIAEKLGILPARVSEYLNYAKKKAYKICAKKKLLSIFSPFLLLSIVYG